MPTTTVRYRDPSTSLVPSRKSCCRAPKKSVLGGDKRSPIAHSNTRNALVSTFLQAKSISGSFKDGERSITLKESNSYFNDKMKSSGKI